MQGANVLNACSGVSKGDKLLLHKLPAFRDKEPAAALRVPPLPTESAWTPVAEAKTHSFLPVNGRCNVL